MDLTPEIADRYKKMSNSELLEVLQNPATYLPEALAIAKSEFNSRQLSENDIVEANQVLQARNQEKEKTAEKIEKARAKVFETGSTVFEIVNPIQSNVPTAEKLIRLICISFALVLIITITMNFRLLAGVLKGDSHSAFNYTVYLFPILLEIAAIALFWKKTPTGWMFMTVFCGYSLAENSYAFYKAITYRHAASILDQFFPRPNPIAYFIPMIFYAGTIFVVTRNDLRGIYGVKKEKIPVALISGALLAVVLLVMASAV